MQAALISFICVTNVFWFLIFFCLFWLVDVQFSPSLLMCIYTFSVTLPSNLNDFPFSLPRSLSLIRNSLLYHTFAIDNDIDWHHWLTTIVVHSLSYPSIHPFQLPLPNGFKFFFTLKPFRKGEKLFFINIIHSYY